MPLSLTLLGGFGFDSGGASLPLAARKARVLIAALALARHRTLSRARLASLLWGSSEPEQARVSLRQAVAQLRRAGIDIEAPEADTLTLPAAIAIDVDAFDAALSRGSAAEAIRLYRGDLMEGQAFRDPIIDSWLQGERVRLRELAVEALVSELDRLGDRPEAGEIARRLIALDPLREAAHRTLMRLDLARGDTAASLARFAMLRDLLRRELDIAPAADTMALVQSIHSSRARRPLREHREDGRASNPVATDMYLRQVVVLAALESEEATESNWMPSLAKKVAAVGGEVTRQEHGQLIAVWGLERTREGDAAAAERIARTFADRPGKTASFGLIEMTVLWDGEATAVERMSHRALRLAAAAAPGTLSVDPQIVRRLARSGRPAPVLVGRETELGQTLGAARESLSSGHGAVIHVTGEAGIGKSELAREVAAQLSACGVAVASIGFDSFDSFVSAAKVGQQIAAALPCRTYLEPSDPFDLAVLTALQKGDLAVSDTLRLHALVPEERLRRDLQMTEALVAEASGQHGLLLIVEDCHWASHAASSFILKLADATAHRPFVMLLTERPNEDSLAPRLAVRGRAPLARLALAHLSHVAAETLARSVSADARRTERALSLAGGHPLFLLRLLEVELADDRLPPTISALVQEQIERLPVTDRTALRQASILGRRFAPADFQAVFGGQAPAPNGDLLVADGELHVFGHELIHRAIFESIPEELRRQLHGRVANHYRARDALRWADHALLADDDADASRAATAAANAMIASRHFRAALPYIESGLARNGDPEATAALYSCRAGVHRIHGELQGALNDYQCAYACAILHTTQVAMLTRTALVLHRLERHAEVDRALDDAEAIADRSGIGGVVRAEIHEQRGNQAFVAGDHVACARHHAAALALVEPTGDLRAIARAHGCMGEAAYGAGRMRTAYRQIDHAMRIAEEGGHGMVIEEMGLMRANALHFFDPGPYAAALADLAVEGGQASGAHRTEMFARSIRAEIRLSALDLEGAARDMDRIDQLLASSNEPRFTDDLVAMRALLAYRRGDFHVAAALIRPLNEVVNSSLNASGLQYGVVVLTSGEAATRQRAIEIANGPVRRSWLSHEVLWFHRLTLEWALRHRDTALVHMQIAKLRDYTAEEPLGWVELAIENAELNFESDRDRGRSFAERAAAAGLRDLPPL